MTRALLLLLILLLPATVWANNTGGDFNNRSNFRPANPETKIVTRNLQHDYSPTIMRDVDGKYRMWWCGSVNPTDGDQIHYAEATSLAGPWTNIQVVFKGTAYSGGSTTGWDANQTCDPSVIRVNGTYYMYYVGINNSTTGISRVGVASSTNGINWTRLNGGQPIITPYDPNATVGTATPGDTSDDYYGAGQGSAMYVDGWFYFYYNDDTGIVPGPGQPFGYLLRSTEPTFPNTSATQELLDTGGQVAFQPLSSSRYAIMSTVNADIMYLPGFQRYVLATASFTNQVTGIFFNKNFVPANPPSPQYPTNAFGYTDIPGTWTEGPAFVRSPWGLGLYSSANLYSSQCVVPLDAVRSVGTLGTPTTYDLAWTGMDVTFNTRCGDVVADNRLDFDGDRVADRIVFRPTGTPTWYKLRSAAGYQTAVFGTNDFIPIHGDFDGDGKDDHGGLDPNAGLLNWKILQSSNGQYRNENPWGLTNDQTAVGDYDADGKDDVAVWRPSNGTWYVKYQSGATFTQAWGVSGDIAVPADYNGDGWADLAIYRPNSISNPNLSEWWVWHYHGNTYQVQQWGFPGDIPVPGDWFADGKADFGVFRPSNGTWYLRNSVTGATETTQFGLPGDVPVVGDYNGDGKLDLTVWRPSNGNWYHNFRNGEPLITVQFGLNGDKIPEK